MKIIRRWNQAAVVKMTLQNLYVNGQVVGKFLEGEARRKLLAIRKPGNRRAVAYRNYLARFVLTHRVDVEGKAVVIRVGMRRGSGKGGMMKGFYIEIGSRTAPATSFLRRSVLENRRTIMKTLAGK